MVDVAPFVIADQLHTKEHCTEYIKAVCELDDLTSEVFVAAFDDVVRSEGACASLKSAGLDAAELQDALAADTYDRFDAVMKILRALGVRLSIAPIEEPTVEAV